MVEENIVVSLCAEVKFSQTAISYKNTISLQKKSGYLISTARGLAPFGLSDKCFRQNFAVTPISRSLEELSIVNSREQQICSL